MFPRLQNVCLKPLLLSLAVMLSFTGNMLEAPFYDGMSGSLFPVIFGLMFVGVAMAFMNLPTIPQLIEILNPTINDPTLKSGIPDMAAALYIMS